MTFKKKIINSLLTRLHYRIDYTTEFPTETLKIEVFLKKYIFPRD